MLSRLFLRDVPLPKDLYPEHVFKALQKTQDFFKLINEKTGIHLSAIIQTNNFSGVISNVFTKMLNDVSPYKSFHDQRYPDLKHQKLGIGLEVKASINQMKGGEGHNGHSGWHIVVCYKILEDYSIEFTQVEIADLVGYEKPGSDWKYLGSKRNNNESQRTETYITNDIGTAKLRDGTLYLNTDLVEISSSLQKAREKVDLPIPEYSIFFRK